MSTLPPSRLANLLAPYAPTETLTPNLLSQLSTYLDLLLKWNARTNLTAIRDPEAIVTRHFGESLFTGLTLAPHLTANSTLLDLGSGAGFPGLPIQLLYPHLPVTLAESQRKKASFLREALRTLALDTTVWAARAEDLPQKFHIVTLRAVDNMPVALAAAESLLLPGGILAVLSSVLSAASTPPATIYLLPGTHSGLLSLREKSPTTS